DKGPLLIQLHLRGRGGKSPPTRRAVGGRGRPPEGRSGSRCSCRRRRGGWSVGCRNHRPGEPARRKPCRRAGDYRTGACPCVRRSEPCRSCNTADGVAVCHSGRKRSSCPDPVGRRPGKQGFDSKSGSGRPSQAGSGIGRNNQLSVVSPDDCAPEKCWENCVNTSAPRPAFSREICERATQDGHHPVIITGSYCRAKTSFVQCSGDTTQKSVVSVLCCALADFAG